MLNSLFEVPVLVIVFFAIGCTYLPIIGFLLIGMIRLPFSKPEALSVLPTVTVLVSARNEEHDLPGCIKSLENLDYPDDKLQVILVNDKSTDSTPDIILAAAERNPHFLAIDTVTMGETHLQAKGRGVAYGFRHAEGEWVFITDADAKVHPNWIKGCLSLSDEKTGMLGGTLIVRPKTFLGVLEQVSWSFVQVFNMGMAGWGIPFACVGPNMAIRKSIYDDAGGLENSGFSVAEDLALLKMVTHAGYKIKTYVDENTSAKITQVPTFGHLVSQQRRWLRGGIDTDDQYLWILAISFGWGFLIATYVIIGWLFSWKLYLLFALVKSLTDLILLSIQKYRLKVDKYARYFWVMQFFYPVVFTILPVSFVFSRKIYWKGDDYEIEYE